MSFKSSTLKALYLRIRFNLANHLHSHWLLATVGVTEIIRFSNFEFQPRTLSWAVDQEQLAADEARTALNSRGQLL